MSKTDGLIIIARLSVGTYLTINTLSQYYTLLMVTMMITGMILFNISPMYNNIRNGVFSHNVNANYTLQYSVYYKLPGFDQNDYFTFSTLLNIWISYVCSVVVCVNDLLLSLIAFQIIGHINILNYNFEHFPVPKETYMIKLMPVSLEGRANVTHISLFSKKENEEIHRLIKDCINHHRFIMSFTKAVSGFFGPMLGLNYMYQLFSCCLLLLECSNLEPDAVARYGPLTVIIFGQLIQISVTFEVIGAMSEKTIEAAYAVPWESMDLSNQRSVCILLNRVQTPIRVTAMGLTTVGVQTMLKILKTTLSYFAFLRSVN